MFFFLFYLLLVLLRVLSVHSFVEMIKVRENVNITITCRLNLSKWQVQQTSENIILWYKDETQVIGVNSISNNPKKYLLDQVTFDTYQLIILNVQLDSSGFYKCQSFIGKEEHHFQVHVLGKLMNICSNDILLSLLFVFFSSTIACSSYSIRSITCNYGDIYFIELYMWTCLSQSYVWMV